MKHDQIFKSEISSEYISIILSRSSCHHSFSLIMLSDPMRPIIFNCCDPIAHQQSEHTHGSTCCKDKPPSKPFPYYICQQDLHKITGWKCIE